MKKILLIDDDCDCVSLVGSILTAHDFEVVQALDGDEGMRRAREETPDLIILDVMMTYSGEGFDIARALRADMALRAIPIIMLSAIRRELNLPFVVEPGEEHLPVSCFLDKPVRAEELLRTVSEVLNDEGERPCPSR